METRFWRSICCFLIGTTVAALCLWNLHGRFGFNLADEGFFWYGAKQTARGEIPGLDFMAYEPGRYYWAAAVFKALGNDSNHAARIASVVFGSVTYGIVASRLVGLRKDFGAAKALYFTAFLASTLSIWSFPYYRITDNAAPCLTFLLSYRQYEDRKLRTSLITGFWIGNIMFFGRNHALYAVLSLGITITFLLLQEKDIIRAAKRILFGTAGLMVGLTPFMVLSLLRPEYPRAIINQWLSILQIGRTNLALPWPLPWRTIDGTMPLTEADGHLFIGLIFMSLFAVAIAGTVLVEIAASKGKWVQPELAAMTATTAGYLHYGIERADMEHIGPAFMPVLLGVILWGMRQKIRLMTIAMFAILIPTTRVAARQQSAYHCIRKTIQCEILRIDKRTKIMTSQETARFTRSALRAVQGKRFLAVPAFPSLYAITSSRSPIWDIYAAWPRQRKDQLKTIKNIKKHQIETVILSKDQFGISTSFAITNPVLFEYLRERYSECRWLNASSKACKLKGTRD